VNQELGSELPGSWQPTSDGIRYDISTSFDELLRLQVVDSNQQSYCQVLTHPFGVALLSDFNTACWDGTGQPYAGGTPLRSVEVLVPSNPSDDQLFGICVNELAPSAVGGGSGADAGAGTAGAAGAGGAPGGDPGDPEVGGASGSGGATGGMDAGVPG
jgi:hypothetical protein